MQGKEPLEEGLGKQVRELLEELERAGLITNEENLDLK